MKVQPITCSIRLYIKFSNYMMYINSGTAVYNQHERQRANEGGRATEGQRYVCMWTAIQQYLQYYLTFFRYIRMLCTTNTNVGGRATEGERYVCTEQYSSTCSSIYIFAVYRQDIYQQSSTSTKVLFFLYDSYEFSATASERRRTSDDIRVRKLYR